MSTATLTNGRNAIVTAIEEVSNDAEAFINPPYRVSVTIKGTAPILFHRWSCEAVAEKAAAAKGSEAKKTDNVESYVYRIKESNHLGIPGEYVRQACIGAAKYRQDPRSPRKSMMDLTEAILICETHLADLGTAQWDYLDQRRVVVQRSGVTRQRPAMEEGWEASFEFCVLMPQYLPANDLLSLLNQAGMLVGVGDFRPSYGRFQVVRFEVL
jgi:hypothetical protein